jgi:hypothetical protein
MDFAALPHACEPIADLAPPRVAPADDIFRDRDGVRQRPAR